jgi:hypothetical protein
MQIRKAIVANQFYDGDKEGLNWQIKNCFLNKEFGPGILPNKHKKKYIMGVISPHAGYEFSGFCAAHSFKEIGESQLPDLYIMLGLSHSGFKTSLSDLDWETPLGILKTHKEFINALKENSNIQINNNTHSQEHSIEVQLPFLQFVNRDVIDKIRIASIIVSTDIEYKKIAEEIRKTINKLKLRVCFITSSDFTHYGLNYGYFPFNRDIKQSMYNLDKKAIEYIEKLQPDKFLAYIGETGATICGYYPITVMVQLSKIFETHKARLLKYYTSGDVVNNYSSAVGYASIVFE